MQRVLLWAAIGLLLLNTAALGWLVAGRRADGSAATLTETQVAQMEKLFRITSDFHHELETITGQASYEDENEKAGGKRFLQAESLAFAFSRLDYEAARRSRGVRDFQTFVAGALYPRSGWGGAGSAAMDAPSFERFVAATYDSNYKQIKPSATVSFANVSKLESLQEQFKVLAQSLVEDIK